ncbi:SWI/SNF and RSC complex subunit Ssr2 [Conglomerata obtusa]
MHTKFPKVEVPNFEEHYGKTHKDAFPIQSPSTHNLNTRVNCKTTLFMPTYASWFDFNTINEIETSALPLSISDPKLYMQWRNAIVTMYRERRTFIGISDVRKIVSCDVVNVVRLHTFLQKWGIINYKIDTIDDNEIDRRDTIEDDIGENEQNYDNTKDDNNILNITREIDHNNDDGTIRHNTYHNKFFEHNTNEKLNVDNFDNKIITENNIKYQNIPDKINFNNELKKNTEVNLDYNYKKIIKCKCGEERNVIDSIFYFNEKENYFICKKCFESGNFEFNHTTDNYKKVEKSVIDNIWTKKDELMLFEMVESCDDWDSIAKQLNKGREQCILHFLKYNLRVDTFKSLHLIEDSIINNMSNPIMSLIAFLCGSVHPKIASEVAKYCLNNLKSENRVSMEVLGCAVVKAKEQKEIEEKKIERLIKVLVELQIKKIELKMGEFEELMKSIEKERKEYEFARENYQKEYEEIKRQRL